MKVEFFLARGDFTWTTEILEVPDFASGGHDKDSPAWDYAVSAWARKEFATKGLIFPIITVWDSSPEVWDSSPEVDDEEEEIANVPQDID